MAKERENYIDICKGICMLCVICIHCELFVYYGLGWTQIFVPMFFFMSGFFDKIDMSFKEFLHHNIKRLILPTLIWVIIGRLFFLSIALLNGEESDYLSFDIYQPAKGNWPAWFLISLLYVKLIVWKFHDLALIIM